MIRLQSSLSFGPDGTGRAVLNHLKPDAPVTLDHLVETLAGHLAFGDHRGPV